MYFNWRSRIIEPFENILFWNVVFFAPSSMTEARFISTLSNSIQRIKCDRNSTSESAAAFLLQVWLVLSHYPTKMSNFCHVESNAYIMFMYWVLRRSVFSSAIWNTLCLKHFPPADIPDSINSDLSVTQVRRIYWAWVLLQNSLQ